MPRRRRATPYGSTHGGALRNLELADRRRHGGARPRLDVLADHRRRRRRVLVGGAPARGRARRDRRAPRRAPRPSTRSRRASAPAPACTSTAAARSPSTPASCSSATTPTSASTAASSRSRPRPPRPSGCATPTCGVAGDRLVCVRERVAEPEHVNELVERRRSTARGEPVVLASRPRLLRRAARLARRDPARVPDLGPPADAVGGLGAVGERARRRAAARGRRRPGGGDRPARVEPGRRPALQLATARAGGTSTAATTSP